MYYFTLFFLLAFTTPVLITTSLNVYITNAVSGASKNVSAEKQPSLVKKRMLQDCIFCFKKTYISKIVIGMLSNGSPFAHKSLGAHTSAHLGWELV